MAEGDNFLLNLLQGDPIFVKNDAGTFENKGNSLFDKDSKYNEETRIKQWTPIR